MKQQTEVNGVSSLSFQKRKARQMPGLFDETLSTFIVALSSRRMQGLRLIRQELRMAAGWPVSAARIGRGLSCNEGKGDSQGKVFASISGLRAPRQKFSDDWREQG